MAMIVTVFYYGPKMGSKIASYKSHFELLFRVELLFLQVFMHRVAPFGHEKKQGNSVLHDVVLSAHLTNHISLMSIILT